MSAPEQLRTGSGHGAVDGTADTGSWFQVDDAATLRAFYQALSDERIDYNVRKWETIRTGALYSLGILAAVGGLLTRESVPAFGYYAASFVLVLAAGLVWWWVRTNVAREAGLQYVVEYSMYQVERLLGLHRMLRPEDRWLSDYPFVVGEKHLDPTYGSNRALRRGGPTPQTLKAWLAAKKSKHSFLLTVDILCGSFFVSAFGFGLVLVLLGLLQG